MHSRKSSTCRLAGFAKSMMRAMRGGACRSCIARLHRHMEDFFFQLGLFVTDHSVAVIVVTLSIALPLSSGVLWLSPEDRYDHLWATPGSKVASANRAVARYFGTAASPAKVIVTSRGENGNILTKAALRDVLALHEALLPVLRPALKHSCRPLADVSPGDLGNRTFTTSLDLRGCASVHTVMGAFEYSAEKLEKASSPVDAIQKEYRSEENARMPLAALLSGAEIPTRANITSSPALRLLYDVDPAYQADFDFDKRFVEAVHVFSKRSEKHVEAFALGPSSLDRETERSLRADMWLVALSGSFLIVFSMVNAGRAACVDPVRSRAGVALCGILNVTLAVGASIGLVTYCGVLFSPMQVRGREDNALCLFVCVCLSLLLLLLAGPVVVIVIVVWCCCC